MSDTDQPSASSQPIATNAPAPTFTLVNWGRRFYSWIIDVGIAWAILVVGLILGGGKMGAVYDLFWLISLGYWIWNMVRQGRTGQSVGKTVVKTKLVLESNAQVVGPAISIGRWLLHIVDVPLLLGYLWPLWDKKRQTFSDKIVGTVVIEMQP